MHASGTKDEFYWLGSVPCRTVLLIAMVIGIRVFEQRILYTLDDGTAVIEVAHRTPQTKAVVPVSPSARHRSHPNPSPFPPPEPIPAASLADSVRVVGKIVPWHHMRRLNVDKIDRCLSGIDDSRHVRRVLTLWKEKYSAPGPFVIPQPPSASFEFNGGRSSADRAAAVTAAKPPPRHDASAIPLAHLPIPKTELNTPRTAYAAPSTVTPSHASDVAKLRHPSRLHSRDLTDNTFRIYLRHYMDRIAETASNDTNEMPPLAGGSRPVIPTSPTPVRSAAGLSSRLPGGTVPAAVRTIKFTLSYLRSVPELSLLAKMVVRMEEKRRARSENAVAKAKTNVRDTMTSWGDKGTRADGRALAKGTKPEEKERLRVKRRHKMKQLFRWAVVELYKEGSIVLWDPDADNGLHLSPPEPSVVDDSVLWKESTTKNGPADGPSLPVVFENDEWESEVSDGPSCEEAYVPLTAGYLAGQVQRVLSDLTGRSVTQGESAQLQRRSDRDIPAPARTKGWVSVEEITRYLRKRDGRWERVGEWAVKDSLDWLKERGRVVEARGGGWKIGT